VIRLLGGRRPDALGVVRLRDNRVAWQLGLLAGVPAFVVSATSSALGDLAWWIQAPLVFVFTAAAVSTWAENTDVLIEGDVLSTDTGNLVFQEHWSSKDIARIEVDVPWFRTQRVLVVRDHNDAQTPLRCCTVGTPNAECVLAWARRNAVALDGELTAVRR
jgi:hypothetical protein